MPRTESGPTPQSPTRKPNKQQTTMRTFSIIAFGVIASVATGNAAAVIIMTVIALMPWACRKLEKFAMKSDSENVKNIVKSLTEE